MKLLPDTNVLIYDTIEDSEHHDLAMKIIDAAKEIFIPSIVIHEYIWVMLKLIKVPPNFVSLKIREYLEDPRVTYVSESTSILVNALRMLEKDKENIKEVNDYIILSTALRYSLTLATFDKKLKKIAIKRGIKVIPQ